METLRFALKLGPIMVKLIIHMVISLLEDCDGVNVAIVFFPAG